MELTGNTVHQDMGFRAYGNFLGGSPDGLIGKGENCTKSSEIEYGNGGGILEVKCPSKPSPYAAMPYTAVPAYYMPQVQGQ